MYRMWIRRTSGGRAVAITACLLTVAACGATAAVAPHGSPATVALRGAADPPKQTATPVPTRAPTAAPPPATSTPRPASTAHPVTLRGGHGPTLGGCAVFPANNAWNQDISAAPIDPNSAAYVARIDSFRQFLHPDFGSDPSCGIPYVVVPGTQPLVPITFTAYGSESDPGPYPVPLSAPVEAGSDAHVLVVDSGNCHLYELYGASQRGSGWDAASGAVFNLGSNALRPDTWTSADAAGLPILPGLARYDEVAAGVINHALRFTVNKPRTASSTRPPTRPGWPTPATRRWGHVSGSRRRST